MFRQLTETLKKFLLNVKFKKNIYWNLYVVNAPKTLLGHVLPPDLDDIFQTDVMILYIA